MTVLQPTTAKLNPWRHPIPVAAIVLLTIILFILTPPCFAQGNGDPSQSATPPPASPPREAGQPSAQIQKLMDLVRELVPYMRRLVERPLLQKFSFIAMILASIVLLFSFIRIIRENNGASSELYYWFGRAIICMALFAIAPAVISTLYKIGRTLTIPIEPMIEEKRTAFNDQYYAFVQGHLIIKDEKNVFIQPAYIEPGEYGWVGVLTDHESGDGKLNGLKAIEGATDMTSWSMPKLFFGLNLARGILQAGELFLWGGASTAIPYAGTGVINPLFGNVAVGNRTRNLNRANNEFSASTIQNETATANTVQQSQFTYRSDMETATQAQLDGNVSAINAGAGTAAGGANRGAAIAKSGVDKAYSLEVQANEVQFGSTTTAAGQIKDANLEAAHLRELSTIITGVARDMDRRIEEGMRQRY